MRTRRPTPEHQAAVARRLAQLGAELSAARIADAPAQVPPAGQSPVADLPEVWWSEHTRVAAPPPSPPPPSPPPPEREPEPGLSAREEPDPAASAGAVVPVPGRHAARRARRLGELVPEPLRGRAALAPGPVAVAAVLVALGLAVTSWWVVRSDAERPVGQLAAAPAAQPLATPAGASPAPAAETGARASAAGEVGGAPDAGATAVGAGAEGTVTVDVAGKVRRPGIAVLPAGSRVVDALEAAGGARRGVDLTGLNLARPLVDGEQVLVGEGVPAPGPVAAPGPGAGSPGAPGALVDLNRASQAELEALPEIGPVTAAAIIAWRSEHGGFRAVEELLEVNGIGDATLATVAPHVTV